MCVRSGAHFFVGACRALVFGFCGCAGSDVLFFLFTPWFRHIVRGSAQSSDLGPGAIFDKCECYWVETGSLGARIDTAVIPEGCQRAGCTHAGAVGLH